MGENVKSVPEGLHTLTPHIVCAGAAEAIEFSKKLSARRNSCACRGLMES